MTNKNLDKIDDVSLMQMFIEGDKKALGEIFNRHMKAAYRIALRYSLRGAEAEDIVQNTFLQMMQRKAPKIDENFSIRSWIFGAVVHNCRQQQRGEGRLKKREERYTMEKEYVSTEKGSGDHELLSKIKTALDILPERLRLPVWMRYQENLNFREIALALSTSESTIYSQVKKGVEVLRQSLQKNGVSVSAVFLTSSLPRLPKDSPSVSLSHKISEMIDRTGMSGRSAQVLPSGAVPKSKLTLWVFGFLSAGVLALGVSSLLQTGASSVSSVGTNVSSEGVLEQGGFSFYRKWNFNEKSLDGLTPLKVNRDLLKSKDKYKENSWSWKKLKHAKGIGMLVARDEYLVLTVNDLALDGEAILVSLKGEEDKKYHPCLMDVSLTDGQKAPPFEYWIGAKPSTDKMMSLKHLFYQSYHFLIIEDKVICVKKYLGDETYNKITCYLHNANVLEMEVRSLQEGEFSDILGNIELLLKDFPQSGRQETTSLEVIE